MRALDPEVGDAVWAAIAPLIPAPDRTHPLGCHRPRASDRDCFNGMLVRLATGCSWEDAERLTGHKVSDTTMRLRRDEWIAAGVFEALEEEALRAYDKIIGFDFSDVSVDGSQHKSPCGGDGTGKSPVDRGKLGWKWSILTDLNGIPFGWAIDGANRHDSILFAPTLDAAKERGLLADIDTLWLDRGYDSKVIRANIAERGIADSMIATQRRHGEPKPKQPQKLGLRWPVERTNSWLSNFANSAATPTGGAFTGLPNCHSPSCACSRPNSSTGGIVGRPNCRLSAEPLNASFGTVSGGASMGTASCCRPDFSRTSIIVASRSSTLAPSMSCDRSPARRHCCPIAWVDSEQSSEPRKLRSVTGIMHYHSGRNGVGGVPCLRPRHVPQHVLLIMGEGLQKRIHYSPR